MENKEYAFTDNLHGQMKGMSNDELEFVQDAIEHYIQEYKDKKKEVDSISVAYGFSNLIDQFFNDMFKTEDGAQLKKRIQCKMGCAHCCKTNVDITNDEADLLVEYAEELKLDLDLEKLERQSKYDLSNWQEQPLEDRSCIFLDEDNKCQVYDHRPINCRKLLVVSHSKHCDIIKHPKHNVARVNSTQAEIVATAVGTAADEFNSMARMILKAIK